MFKKFRHYSLLTIIALILATIPAGPLSAQTKIKVSGQNAWDYVRVMAGEDMDSRKGGLPGGNKAAAWIADQFKAWGLEPAGTNGYFQDFKKSASQIEKALFSIDTGTLKKVYNGESEFKVADTSGSASVRGELVYAGYGIESKEAGWNDFEGLDLKGKIALMINYGAPAHLAAQLGMDAMPETKIAKAYAHGARAVIFMNSPKDVMDYFSSFPHPAWVMAAPGKIPADMAVAGINDIAVKEILRKSGKDLSYRIEKSAQDKKPCSEALGIQGVLEVKNTVIPEAPFRNVLAKITGSDRNLKNEYIILGGHYDGLGRAEDGHMRPGADDNASGTAAIMEIARVMKANKARPKRTVIFACWDGEEQGLYGSVHYAQNPIYPLAKTLVNLNLDMVGNGNGRLRCSGLYYGAEIWDFLKKSLPADMMANIDSSRGGPGGSDHTPFLLNGVPAFFVATAGAHFGRHDEGDKLELVDPALLETSAEFVMAATEVLADAKGLKPNAEGNALNILKSTNIIDLEPREGTGLIQEVASADYPDLDGALIALTGQTPVELTRNFFETTEAFTKAGKFSLHEGPAKARSFSRPGSKFAILPGIADISKLGGQDDTLRLLGKAGLAYIVIQDKDFAAGDETVAKIVKAANSEAVLIIARMSDAKNMEKIIDMSAQPGMLRTAAPAENLIGKMQQKRWRLALEWKAGTTPEQYAASFDKFKKALSPRNVLVVPGSLKMKGFSPELVKLTSLLIPKPMPEMFIHQGNLDEFGQNLITTYYELRPMSF